MITTGLKSLSFLLSHPYRIVLIRSPLNVVDCLRMKRVHFGVEIGQIIVRVGTVFRSILIDYIRDNDDEDGHEEMQNGID